MTHKVIINPKTGRAETVNDYTTVTAEQVATTRRKLRDMLSGNTPFHEDEFAAPTEEKKEEHDDIVDDASYMYGGYFGFAGVMPT